MGGHDMSVRPLLGRAGAMLGIGAFALVTLAVDVDAARPGKSSAPRSGQAARTLQPEAVNSRTIYGDGDATSDLYFSPAPVAGNTGFQDYWFLVRGDIVSTSPPPPFNIETVSYFYRQVWNATFGTVGVWTGGNLTTPVATGSDPTVSTGFNNFTLPTPLTIPAVGTGVFWLGVIHSYAIGSTAVECTSCRTVGLDDVGVNAASVGFFKSAEATPFPNPDITGPTAFGSNRVPIIRAGITANGNTVPVELMEFGVR
jgi:hypothetical protein